ncbi:MAG: ABC transporter permease, partial [Tepidisphaeraceae bacterium]
MSDASVSIRPPMKVLLAAAHAGRVLLLLLAVFAVMSVLAPQQFPTAANLANILRATSTDVLAAAGFTIVMLCGQLDLSVGTTMTLGGVVVMFMQPSLGWTGAALAAGAAGSLVGLGNGLLVSKARINSFIVTLGTMTILQGVSRSLLHGGSKSLENVAAGMRMVDWLEPILPWSPRILLVFVPVVLLELFLRRTAWGRGFYLIGGNPQTAWYAGLRTGRSVTVAFTLSGMLSALGGALAAMSQNTAMPNLGDKSLMLIVAAVVVGGTAMAGGRGSVVMSILALIALNALTNGLSYLGASKSVKLIANGVLLALVIIYEAWRNLLRERVRGQRRELLARWESEADEATPVSEESAEEELTMPNQDRTFAIVCVCAVACVAIVAIFA